MRDISMIKNVNITKKCWKYRQKNQLEGRLCHKRYCRLNSYRSNNQNTKDYLQGMLLIFYKSNESPKVVGMKKIEFLYFVCRLDNEKMKIMMNFVFVSKVVSMPNCFFLFDGRWYYKQTDLGLCSGTDGCVEKVKKNEARKDCVQNEEPTYKKLPPQ
jgi:hypothetical protein